MKNVSLRPDKAKRTNEEQLTDCESKQVFIGRGNRMRKSWIRIGSFIVILLVINFFWKVDLVKAENLIQATTGSDYVKNPETQGWIKVVGKSPRAQISISEEQSLDYGFQGLNESAPPKIDAKKSSFVPNVYFIDNGEYVGGLYNWKADLGTSFPVNLVFGRANSLSSDDKINGYTIDNPRYYKKIDSDKNMTALMFKGDRLRDPSNRTAINKQSRFDVTIIMSAVNGAVKIDTYVENNSNPDLVQADWYKEVALYTLVDTELKDNDYVPVRFIGNNRGLYIEQDASKNVKGVYRLNYNFRLANPVANWKAGKFGVMASDQPVFNRNFGGFGTYDASGAEKAEGVAGAHAYDAFPSNIPRLIDTAIFMKSKTQAFPIGSVMGYSYSVGLQKLDDKPIIILDEAIGIAKKDDPNGYFISGQWGDLDSTQVTLAYQIDDGPIITLGTQKGKAGVNHDFRFDFTNKIKPKDQKITFYATDNTNIEAKPVEQQVIYLDSAPVLKLETKNILLNPSNTEYLVTGKVIDDKRKPDKVFYKPFNAPNDMYKEVAMVADGNSAFSFGIQASDVPYSVDAEYIFDIRAVDKYGMASEVEQLKIAANHPKPTLSLDENEGVSLGQDYEVKLTQDHVKEFYPLYLEYKVGDAPFKKLDIAANKVESLIIQDSDAKKRTFTIPKTEIPAESGHIISIRIVDRFDVTSIIQSLVLEKVNKPIISADFQFDKTKIVEGDKVTVTSTIQNTAIAPSIWQDVVYETLESFPPTIDVDRLSIKLNDQAIPPSDITMSPDRKLQIKLGTVDPNIEWNLIYDIISKIAVPVLKEDFEVKQGYKVTGNSVIAGQAEEGYTELKTVTVNRRTSKLSVFHIEEKTMPENELFKEEPKEGTVGDKVAVTAHHTEGYILSKVLIDGEEKIPLPKEDFEVVYGEVKEVKFYYKGILRLNSVPEIMDFGQHEATFRKIRVNQPNLDGQKLAITDTRQSKKEWSLKAVLIQEFTNIDDPNSRMTGILRYNRGAKESETIFELNKVEELMKHTNDSNSEFVVSDTWSESGFGFKMEVPNGGGKIGKYQARIEYRLGDTP